MYNLEENNLTCPTL